MGDHLLGHWCRIQNVVALSSGEAELYASVTGITRALGFLHLGRSVWGDGWGRVQHHLDSSACKSIICRKGSGSIKHLSTKDLWIQEAVRRYAIEVQYVPRDRNPADSLASYSCPRVMSYHLELINQEVGDILCLRR